MLCCMYPSLFGFKKLTDQHQIVNSNSNSNMSVNNKSINNMDKMNNNVMTNCQNEVNQNIHNDYDSISMSNNLEEFKSLFKTQEKMCYELRSENTVLKMKLEVANEMNRNKQKKIQSLKMKKNKLEIENNVYKGILYGSSLSINNSECNKKYITNERQESTILQPTVLQSYPPPPPPPLPLPPQNKLKVNGNFLMDNLLDELKSKIKLVD